MGFDLAVIGEGEITLPAPISKVLNDQNHFPTKGIAYLDQQANYIKFHKTQR